jgi:hypothetical protein
MISVKRGVLLDADDAGYVLAALDALLRDRRPSARLQGFLDRLRKTVVSSGVSASEAGVGARIVGGGGDSPDYAEYDLLDTNEAAAILRISPNGVRDLARRGRLPVHRAGGRLLYPAAAVVARAERRAAKRG